jgi:hypothetical protein
MKLPWQYIDRNNEIILLSIIQLLNGIPDNILNRISIESTGFIEADRSCPSGGCAFILSWNHILLDAKGTTLCLNTSTCCRKINKSFDIFPGRKENKYCYLHPQHVQG